MFYRVLEDVKLYDKVARKLRDILISVYQAEEKLEYIARLKKYYQSLQDKHKSTFKEYMSDIKRIIALDSTPVTKDENVLGLIEVVVDAAKEVPNYVHESKKKKFQLDRVDLILTYIDKFELIK